MVSPSATPMQRPDQDCAWEQTGASGRRLARVTMAEMGMPRFMTTLWNEVETVGTYADQYTLPWRNLAA